MRPFSLYIICIITLFSSCDWVNDDLSECPTGTWLKISYTYNILDVDAAATQVGDITVFAFDKNDKFVGQLDVDSITLHQGYCMVRMPFSEGTYHLLIWGGISDRVTYRHLHLSAGLTDRKSLNISLSCNDENQSSGKLSALFYGSLENINVGQEYQVFSVGLMKNTNDFSCILQDEANGSLRPEDFSFVLESANGIMDYTNNPVGTTPVFYHPYQQEMAVISEDTPVVHARLNTLRMMKGDRTTLSIKHVPSGQEILSIPLTQYLLLSKIYNHLGEMSDQEYLDRQDSYTLLFFIKSSDTGIPQICPKLIINGWSVRLNNPELES